MTREDYPVTRSGMARFEPLDRFHWPSIVGGAFLALSLFVISVVLSRAIGLDYTYQTARTEGQRNTIIIWGVVAAFICFWLGSWLAVRTAVVATRGYGLLNGMMVWALAVPVLVYSLGSNLGPRLGLTSVEPIPTALRIGSVRPVSAVSSLTIRRLVDAGFAGQRFCRRHSGWMAGGKTGWRL